MAAPLAAPPPPPRMPPTTAPTPAPTPILVASPLVSPSPSTVIGLVDERAAFAVHGDVGESDADRGASLHPARSYDVGDDARQRRAGGKRRSVADLDGAPQPPANRRLDGGRLGRQVASAARSTARFRPGRSPPTQGWCRRRCGDRGRRMCWPRVGQRRSRPEPRAPERGGRRQRVEPALPVRGRARFGGRAGSWSCGWFWQPASAMGSRTHRRAVLAVVTDVMCSTSAAAVVQGLGHGAASPTMGLISRDRP